MNNRWISVYYGETGETIYDVFDFDIIFSAFLEKIMRYCKQIDVHPIVPFLMMMSQKL